MPTPNNQTNLDADAQAALQSLKGKEEHVIQGARQTLAQAVPILHVEIQPTNVDPGAAAGVGNMASRWQALEDEYRKQGYGDLPPNQQPGAKKKKAKKAAG